ncbi:murein biosynthesis integral membrane protein MurJ [Jeotgalibaca dankookensis]|uniref:murein biosynthesis integral membrane protein MurJ n=1 Tax=Jeotgalibaca dankookensis TaxID=708126 RepID=UPI000784E931|nr:murein biosynthesis integral membrane protein MurJ [Jeotgalibaca dankookensis]
MKKTVFLLMLVTILSKVIGFGREITLSYFYGTSSISDAYLIALTIPTVVFSFVGRGISTGYIPMYTKIEELGSTDEANRFTSNLINILIIISTLIIIIGITFANPLVKIFASGFDESTMKLAIKFTSISMVGVYFTGLTFIFTGFLQIKNNYIVPALIGIPMSIISMVSIVLSETTNLSILPIGIVVASASQVLILIPFVFRNGYNHIFKMNFKDKYIKKMLYISMPIILGVAVDDINVLVDRTVASRIAEGGISALNYANILTGFVQGIFVLSIATAIYPSMSKMAATNNIVGLKATISRAITSINLLVVPMSVGVMLFSNEIISLLFARGAFDEIAIKMTSDALFFYSVGMIGVGLRVILNRSFYSLQDTKTPMINASIALIINVILNIVLSKIIGIGGLALATSISSIICVALMFISLQKKIGPFGMKEITKSFLKIVFASLIMGVGAMLSFDRLTIAFPENFSLIVAIFIGVMLYFIIISFLRIDSIDEIKGLFKKKMRK